MDSNDLVQIFINFSQSLGPIQNLLRGLSYLLGIFFILKALLMFHKIAGTHHGQSSGESYGKPMSYLAGGSVLLFLPSAFVVASNTLFGSANVLQYASTNPVTLVSAILLLIETAGLIWFMRGCVLLMTERHPSEKKGPKGMIFLIAGILAMNIEATAAMLNTILQYILTMILHVKNVLGY